MDAEYVVHDDMKSQTGGTISFGHGTVNFLSIKQKLNTNSSTESKLLGTRAYFPFNSWIKMSTEAQIYAVRENILFQDNKGNIRMELNGRKFLTVYLRHISIRYLFVKERVDKR